MLYSLCYDVTYIINGAFGLLCQLLYLACNNRKALAVLTGSCCLNGCIESQNIGLVGNTRNDLCNTKDLLGLLSKLPDDVPALIGAFIDLLHSACSIIHLALVNLGGFSHLHRKPCKLAVHLGKLDKLIVNILSLDIDIIHAFGILAEALEDIACLKRN